MGLLAVDYVVQHTRSEKTPEEKLAEGIVKDWLETLLSLAVSPLKEKALTAWKKETAWPDTDNARFWIEDVLKGNVENAKTIRDLIVGYKQRMDVESLMKFSARFDSLVKIALESRLLKRKHVNLSKKYLFEGEKNETQNNP